MGNWHNWDNGTEMIWYEFVNERRQLRNIIQQKMNKWKYIEYKFMNINGIINTLKLMH